jgi:hypothetical protein
MRLVGSRTSKEAKAALARYELALKQVKSGGGSSVEQIDAAHAELAESARVVLSRVDGVSEGRTDAVLKNLHRRYAPLLLRARDVEPCTLRQFELKAEFSKHGWKQVGTATHAICAAQDLRDQISRDKARQPSQMERHYGQLRAEQSQRLAQVALLDELHDPVKPVNVPPETLRAYQDAKTEFDRAWAAYHSAHEALNGGANASEADLQPAMDLLQEARRLGDEVIGYHRAILDARMNAMELERSRSVLDPEDLSRLLSAPAIGLCRLQAEQYESLMTALNTNLDFELEHPATFKSLVAQLHSLTSFDAKFIADEAALRTTSIRQLVDEHGDKLQEARARWADWSPERRFKALQALVVPYCATMNLAPPVTRLEDLGNPRIIGQYEHAARGSSVLRINPKAYGAHDFELVMSTVFHELAHCRQWKIIDDDPYRSAPQTKLFTVNLGRYDALVSSDAYEHQPLEAHAFQTGRASVRELIRLLDER